MIAYAHDHAHQPESPDRLLPPSNLEAELGAVGSMLLDNDCIDDVLAVARPVDFSRDAHRLLAEGIRDLRDAGRPVDSITLAEHLMAAGLYDRAGGDNKVAEIFGATPHAANAAYYAGIVRDKAILRRTIDACNTSLRACYAGQESAESVLAGAEARLANVTDGRDGGAVPLSAVLPEAMARILARESGIVPGVPTGLVALDTPLGGCLADGELTLLAARPSAGKTAVALHIAAHVAVDRGVPVAFYSLEMGRRELAERLYCARSGVASDRLRRPWLMNDHDWGRLDAATAVLQDAPLYIDDRRGWDVAALSADARRLRRRHGLGLIVIDYVQLMEAEPEQGRGVNRQEQVARISRRLKVLAGVAGVPVLALSQLNRESEKREDRRPRMSDLRESGSLEQDADVVLLIHRPERYDPHDKPGIAEVQIAKQRNGPAGEWIDLAFHLPTGRFTDLNPGI